jgi:large subunit ribosomal protein L4
MVNMLEAVKAGKKALVVLPEVDDKVIKSFSNIPGVKTTQFSNVNVYDVLNADTFVIDKAAVTKMEEVFAK